MTKAEKIIEKLVSRNCVEVIPSKSRKYRQFKITDTDREIFYWVGKHGGCRVGRTISDSMSVHFRV